MSTRVISWFSCGAASAYATYLASLKYPAQGFEAVYCRVVEEHPDNMRFLEEYSEVTGIPIKIIGDEKFDCSIYRVFRSRKFIKGPLGAPCTMILKKWQRQDYERWDDTQVFGYTSEEGGRIDRFIDANNEVDADFILHDSGKDKKSCIDFVKSLGIELPPMYKLGYSNNNCIGCVKGGMGYWNAIREDFPEAFQKMSRLEREIGHAVNKDKNGPVYLDTLEVGRGNFKRDMPGDCGFTCESPEDL